MQNVSIPCKPTLPIMQSLLEKFRDIEFLTLQVTTFTTVMLERITVNCPQLRVFAICTPRLRFASKFETSSCKSRSL
jgi:hypothetical protein